MAILDWERFHALPPRSGLTVVCQCDQCGQEINVQKYKLYSFYKDGRMNFYKSGEEPPEFCPNYKSCKECAKGLNKGSKRKPLSSEAKEVLRKYWTGRRVGSNHPSWNPDREAVERKARTKKTAKNLIWNAIIRCKQKKTDRTHKLLGYSAEELVNHLESQFTEGMAWENIAVDHRIPVKAFIDHDIVDMSIINHLSNLQPLFRVDNLRKGDRYLEEDFQTYMARFSDLITEASACKYEQLSFLDLL
jgi:hypothetical protein